MSLKLSYSLLSPIYDAMVARATAPMREASLAQLGRVDGQHILLSGVGTGLDFPYLPRMARYTGIDITPAMLERARRRCPGDLMIDLQVGDVQALPFPDNSFDQVILHLILAVAPQPMRTLQEAQRVVKPGGRILIVDKFIRRGQLALTRRLLNVMLRHIATRTDVVFEDVLAQCPQLQILSDTPALGGGWFRRIVLQKQTASAEH